MKFVEADLGIEGDAQNLILESGEVVVEVLWYVSSDWVATGAGKVWSKFKGVFLIFTVDVFFFLEDLVSC